MRRIVILSSAESADHLSALLAAQADSFNGQIVAVVTSHPQSPALGVAKDGDAATETLDWTDYCRWGRPNALYEEDLAHLLQKYSPDLILLDGWTVPLSRRFVRYFPWRVLTVSKGLIDETGRPLPTAGGMPGDSWAGLTGDHVIRAALESGTDRTGSTVHVVLDAMEHGPVVTRASVPVEAHDTLESLKDRWLSAEREALIKSLDGLCREMATVTD